MARDKFFAFSLFAAAVAIGITCSAPVSAQETNDPKKRFKTEQTEKFAKERDKDRHHGHHCLDLIDGDHDHDHDCHKPVSP